MRVTVLGGKVCNEMGLKRGVKAVQTGCKSGLYW